MDVKFWRHFGPPPPFHSNIIRTCYLRKMAITMDPVERPRNSGSAENSCLARQLCGPDCTKKVKKSRPMTP